jgi:hypothetical protein
VVRADALPIAAAGHRATTHGGTVPEPTCWPVDAYLGLTQAEVEAKWLTGESLGQIADAEGNGKSANGLEQAILNGFKSMGACEIAGGVMTPAQARNLGSAWETQAASDVNRHALS